ncbi:MAG: NifB/NifX family molybdenum-iron cluster-binding protein [Bacteroidales bacterium]|nr:NifB/NifX family molybdenum-iron cluster-binding protein [Bacteroidales bacterium]MDD4529521.1 NifB/NifX family molybdenum-iron cluster-binding protein [Bacteroidales bacterium]MDD4829046.1 NifB/NifX family molybdenum-iron cluster-binding protein [Bacteroidales bacterium]
MKIAVPTRNEMVDSHFGHCESYTIFTIDNENKNILSKESLPSPVGCGCKSNIASVLHEMGVEIMLAGNMGDGAVYVLESNGIEIVRGCSGKIEDVVIAFLNGIIEDSGESCSHHHEDGEECHHNH